MQATKSVEGILEDVITEVFGNDQDVRNVSVVSKTGLSIAGKSVEEFGGETFSAMAAIMFSAAETNRKDVFKEDMEYLLTVYRKSKLIITELTSNLLIAVLADRGSDEAAIVQKMREVAARTKAELSWLK